MSNMLQDKPTTQSDSSTFKAVCKPKPKQNVTLKYLSIAGFIVVLLNVIATSTICYHVFAAEEKVQAWTNHIQELSTSDNIQHSKMLHLL